MSDDRLELRAKPRPVRRFNRKALIAIGGVTGLIVLGAAAMALRAPERSGPQQQELYNTTTKPMPDGLNELPASYADVKPALGPPMPGDLGAAMIGREREPVPTDNPFRYEPGRAATGGSGRTASTSPQAQLADAASLSKLFFITHEDGADDSSAKPRRPEPP